MARCGAMSLHTSRSLMCLATRRLAHAPSHPPGGAADSRVPGKLFNATITRESGSNAPTQGGQPVLELNGLSKNFGGLHAVREVTLKIMAGDRKTIIGPNGAGKTTLFNLITGEFFRPRRGKCYCWAGGT